MIFEKTKLSLLYNFSVMKHLVLIFVLLLTTFNSIAQDSIVKRNNERIAAKIIEVSSTEVKFKRFDYQDGPVFILKNWEILNIVYANGLKESFKNYPIPSPAENENVSKKNLVIQPSGKYYYYQGIKITEPDMLDIAKKVNDKKINLMVDKTLEKRYLRKSFFYGGIAIYSVGLLTSAGIITIFNSTANTIGNSRSARAAVRLQHQQTGRYIMLGAVVCEIVSVTFKIQERHRAHLVVDSYNNIVSH